MNNLDLFNFSDTGLAINYSSGCYVLNSRVRYGGDGNCNFIWNVCESRLVNCELSANGIPNIDESLRKGQCFNLEGDANGNYIIKNNIHTGYRGVYIKRGSDGNIVKDNFILDVNFCVDISTTEDQSDMTIPNIGNEIRNNTMSFANIIDRGGSGYGISIDCGAETKISDNIWDGGTQRPVFTFLNIHEKCVGNMTDLHFSTHLIDNDQSGGGAFLTSGPGLDGETIDGLIITGNDIDNNDVSCIDYAYSRADIELCGGDVNNTITGGTLLSNSSIIGNSKNNGPISASFTGEQFTDFNTGALGGVITNNVTTQLCPCFSPGHNINCLHTLNLSGTTSNSEPLFNNSNDYEAFNAIQSDQCVDSPHVIYDAGETINLLPGFKIPATTDFEAIIDGCGGSQRNIEGQEDSLKENSDSNKD